MSFPSGADDRQPAGFDVSDSDEDSDALNEEILLDPTAIANEQSAPAAHQPAQPPHVRRRPPEPEAPLEDFSLDTRFLLGILFGYFGGLMSLGVLLLDSIFRLEFVTRVSILIGVFFNLLFAWA